MRRAPEDPKSVGPACDFERLEVLGHSATEPAFECGRPGRAERQEPSVPGNEADATCNGSAAIRDGEDDGAIEVDFEALAARGQDRGAPMRCGCGRMSTPSAALGLARRVTDTRHPRICRQCDPRDSVQRSVVVLQQLAARGHGLAARTVAQALHAKRRHLQQEHAMDTGHGRHLPHWSTGLDPVGTGRRAEQVDRPAAHRIGHPRARLPGRTL
jgi:hypothetical protein